jgi:hypothetical protein
MTEQASARDVFQSELTSVVGAEVAGDVTSGLFGTSGPHVVQDFLALLSFFIQRYRDASSAHLLMVKELNRIRDVANLGRISVTKEELKDLKLAKRGTTFFLRIVTGAPVFLVGILSVLAVFAKILNPTIGIGVFFVSFLLTLFLPEDFFDIARGAIRPISALYRFTIALSLFIAAMYLGSVGWIGLRGQHNQENFLENLPNTQFDEYLFGIAVVLCAYFVLSFAMAGLSELRKLSPLTVCLGIAALGAFLIVAIPIFRSTGYFFRPYLYDYTIGGLGLLVLRIASTGLLVYSPLLFLTDRGKIVDGLSTWPGLLLFFLNNILTVMTFCRHRGLDVLAPLKLVLLVIAGDYEKITTENINDALIVFSISAVIGAAESCEQWFALWLYSVLCTISGTGRFRISKIDLNVTVDAKIDSTQFVTGLCGAAIGLTSTYFMFMSFINIFETSPKGLKDSIWTTVISLAVLLVSVAFEFAPGIILGMMVGTLVDVYSGKIKSTYQSMKEELLNSTDIINEEAGKRLLLAIATAETQENINADPVSNWFNLEFIGTEYAENKRKVRKTLGSLGSHLLGKSRK